MWPGSGPRQKVADVCHMQEVGKTYDNPWSHTIAHGKGEHEIGGALGEHPWCYKDHYSIRYVGMEGRLKIIRLTF